MGEFENFFELYQIIVVTISSISSIFLLNVLEHKINGKGLKTVIVVTLVSIGVIVINYGITNLLEKSSSIRKFIDEDNFIEGYYYDVTLKDTINRAAILNIKYKNNGYLIFGESFDITGKNTSIFNSVKSVYSDRILYFNFNSYTDSYIQRRNLYCKE